ncbi:MAG: hypothetical protein IT204_20530 [Fimbriimonadaceae bacterium]|nr:hypothetical protein [Fimbriimonadaceae bacterium]
MGHRAIFTHNDLDGLVSALLARVALPDADVYFCEYSGLPGTVRARLQRYDVMWFTDLSMRDEPLFEEIRAAGIECYWFDHHASSLRQDWMVECRIDLSGERCAADVVKQYLLEQGLEIPVPVQTLADYAHDQDLWIRHLPAAQEFNDILGSLSVQELYDELTADPLRVYDWSPRMREAAEQTQAARRRSITLARATAVSGPLGDDQRILAVCCWGSVNEVAEELGDPHTLMVLLDLRQLERGQAKYSFRTKSDAINSNAIAEALDGGGHPKASGAPLGLDVLHALTGELVSRIQGVAASVGQGAPRCE